VWAAGKQWRDQATEVNTLGYNPDSVYHVHKTLDHIGSTLRQVQSSGLEALDNECGAGQRTRARPVTGNVPLANHRSR